MMSLFRSGFLETERSFQLKNVLVESPFLSALVENYVQTDVPRDVNVGVSVCALKIKMPKEDFHSNTKNHFAFSEEPFC